MDLDEFIKLETHKVRNSESLMGFYLEEFERIFGRRPNCAGCTFKSDWKKFINRVKSGGDTKINKVMANKKKSFSLQPRHTNTIFTYLNDKKRPVRTYGFNMTEDFAKQYLSTGNKAQKEDRKKAFKVLPGETFIKSGDGLIELSKATGKDMDEHAEANDIDFGEATKVDEKREIIAKEL
jgi:hypothetical protein